jgi:hypothetical protein
MVVDHLALADEVDNFVVLCTAQRAAARRTVASHALDVTDCRELFAMLGIDPTQERDEVPEVARPKLPQGRPALRKPSMKRVR